MDVHRDPLAPALAVRQVHALLNRGVIINHDLIQDVHRGLGPVVGVADLEQSPAQGRGVEVLANARISGFQFRNDFLELFDGGLVHGSYDVAMV